MSKGYKISWVDDNWLKVEFPGNLSFPAYILTNKGLSELLEEEAIEQIGSITLLPHLVAPPLAMPDIHTGYGFPIGGVAAFDLEKGLISPGGVGYDICCGVRLIGTQLFKKDISKDLLHNILSLVYREVPVGVGAKSFFRLNNKELKRVVEKGVGWVLEKYEGIEGEPERIENGGCYLDADFDNISKKAKERGATQLGTLGGGNHFIEISYIEKVFDKKAASHHNIFPDQIVILFHSGSRGFGHQIASDYISLMREEFIRNFPQAANYKELCCTYFKSDLGQKYYGAMQAAANWAFANRSLISEKIVSVLEQIFRKSRSKLGIYLIGDISHNIARQEEVVWKGRKFKALIHRKGAVRATNDRGIPLILPGDMERGSYLLEGTEKAYHELLNSVSHGAGRKLSRRKAMKNASSQEVLEKLKMSNIEVIVDRLKNLPQEMPEAYKKIDNIVEILTEGGFVKKIAKVKPLGVIKG